MKASASGASQELHLAFLLGLQLKALIFSFVFIKLQVMHFSFEVIEHSVLFLLQDNLLLTLLFSFGFIEHHALFS